MTLSATGCTRVLCAPAIPDRKLVVGIRWKQLGNETETVSESLRRQQRILTLPQLGVVEVDRQGELIDRQGVRKRRLKKICLGLLINDRFAINFFRLPVGRDSETPALPCILAGLAANISERLSPRELLKRLRNTENIDEGVADVDEELKRQCEAVTQQPCGDEDPLNAIVTH